MTNGWLFLGITALICVGVFLNGVRFSRKTVNPFVGRRLGSVPVGGHELTLAQLQRFGRLQMIAAPVFLLFFTALAFGLFGPVDGIQTIQI